MADKNPKKSLFGAFAKALVMFGKTHNHQPDMIESTKQFEVFLEQIMFYQGSDCPADFRSDVIDTSPEKLVAALATSQRLEQIPLEEGGATTSSGRPPASFLIGGLGNQADGEKITLQSVEAYNTRITTLSHPLPLFAFPIPKLMPILVMRTLQFKGLFTEGIFRKSTDLTLLEHFITDVDHGKAAHLDTADPHIFASLFKLWLRKLKDPAVPAEMYRAVSDYVKECEKLKDELPAWNIKDSFEFFNCNGDDQTLSPITVFINSHFNPLHNLCLKYVIRFLRVFSLDPYVKTNLMTQNNVATVMASNIMHWKADTPLANPLDAFFNIQIEMRFTFFLLAKLCITAAEERLFESLDASVREELKMPEEEVKPLLSYYTWE